MTNEKACIASKNMSLDILRIIAALMVLMVHVGHRGLKRGGAGLL